MNTLLAVVALLLVIVVAVMLDHSPGMTIIGIGLLFLGHWGITFGLFLLLFAAMETVETLEQKR